MNDNNAQKTDEFEVTGIIENIVPNVCVMASICASFAVKILYLNEYDFIYYNAYRKINLELLKMDVEKNCIVCGKKIKKNV